MDAAEPGTGEVTATVIVNAPAERVFAAFIAWERQSEWIPFTKVRVVEGDGGEGSLIEAVTALGPAVLRDEMRVVRLDPPYEVRVVHCGQLLRGPGVLRCTPMGRRPHPGRLARVVPPARRRRRPGGVAGALARFEAQPHPGAEEVRPAGRAGPAALTSCHSAPRTVLGMTSVPRDGPRDRRRRPGPLRLGRQHARLRRPTTTPSGAGRCAATTRSTSG